MKHMTLIVVLIGVTAVNLAFRHGLSNPVAASRSPDRADKRDRLSGIDGPARTADKQQGSMDGAALNVSRCAADLSKDAAPGDVVLARIAAECGNHLFEKARHSPDNPHLLPQAAQHYRACLAHEPTSPDAGSLFRDARARLDQIERLLARRDTTEAKRTASPIKPTRAVRPAEQAAPQSKPVDELKPLPEENPTAEKNEEKMVGPDGVIYTRNVKR
jgi:hypothetical protein